MTIIFSIIALVALISLYDYFSARNWQQVTSAVRNDVVFEKRNKAYGAYVIRKDYNKRMILIMVGMIGSVGVGYGAFLATRALPEMAAVGEHDTDLDTVILDLTKEKIFELPKIEKLTSAPAKLDLTAFVAPKVTDDEVFEDRKVIEDGDPVGPEDQEGDDEFGDPVLVDIVDTNTVTVKPPVFTGGPVEFVDEEAQFPGGKEKMKEYLQKNLVFPEEALDGEGGKCYLRFVVSKEGDISNVKVTRGLVDCPACEREAMRVIKKMPNWRPGKVNGHAVDSYFDMPINFVVKND